MCVVLVVQAPPPGWWVCPPSMRVSPAVGGHASPASAMRSNLPSSLPRSFPDHSHHTCRRPFLTEEDAGEPFPEEGGLVGKALHTHSPVTLFPTLAGGLGLRW